MRKLGIAAALASTTIAMPAVARDHSMYAGVEGGALWLEDGNFDANVLNGPSYRGAVKIRHHGGFDADVLAGYDFGLLRLEGELGYKRASINQLGLDARLSNGGPYDSFDASGRSRALSGMANLLADFGNEGLSGYAGAGVGFADVKMNTSAVTPNGTVRFGESQTKLAWQAIAGLRYAVGPNIDVGLKYRFFNVPRLRLDGAAGASVVNATGQWRSHSLLASVIYNFYTPPPPPPPPVMAPPPPPPAPATQTCPDGSVIMATDTCPAPPPPPPPPAPAPERGL